MNTSNICSEHDLRGGKPCIGGHRFTAAQMLAEIADGRTIAGFADDFDFEEEMVVGAWLDLVGQFSLLNINSKYIIGEQGKANCIRETSLRITDLLMDLLVGFEKDCTIYEWASLKKIHWSLVKGALDDLAVLLDRDWTNGPPENITKAIEEGPT